MSLPEALKIVSDNAHGIKHDYWITYLPAVLIVNEAYPMVDYVTVEEDDGHEFDLMEYRQETNRTYDERNK